MKNTNMLEDLEFIKKVLSELSVSEYDYDFGPAYELAKDRKKLANIKLNRIIRQLRLNIQPTPTFVHTNSCLICGEDHGNLQCPHLQAMSNI